VLNGKMSFVRKAFFEDNTELRLVFCDGSEEIVMLKTLQKEAADDVDFVITE
jgi:hypothetical protein